MQLLAKIASVSLLHRTCLALEKQQIKSCFVRLSKTSLEIAVLPANESGMIVWVSLDAKDVYEEVRIESKNNDLIVLELTFEHLTKAIKANMQGQEMFFKLIKRDDLKMLAVFSKSQTSQGLQVTVEQCIPVRVLRPDETPAIRAPEVPDAQINVVLPSAQGLRTVLDRMKTMGSQVAVTVNKQGELRLHVQNDSVDVVTQYKDLQIAVPVAKEGSNTNSSATTATGTGGATGGGTANSLEARVDVKELHRALAVHLAQPAYIVCSISRGRTVILYAALDDAESGRKSNYIAMYLPTRSVTEADENDATAATAAAASAATAAPDDD